MKRIKYNNKGVTLIELLIVLAILGIILQVTYFIFFVGNKSFNISKNEGFAQQDARIIATIITDELKNAKEISFNELEGKYYSLRFHADEKELYKDVFNKNGTKQVSLILSDLYNVSFRYNIDTTNKGFLNILIVAKEGQNTKEIQEYKLEFDVLLENISNYEESISKSSNRIFYYKYEQ